MQIRPLNIIIWLVSSLKYYHKQFSLENVFKNWYTFILNFREKSLFWKFIVDYKILIFNFKAISWLNFNKIGLKDKNSNSNKNSNSIKYIFSQMN
jgi:hypothetical protein